MPKFLVYIPPQGVDCVFETAQPTVIYNRKRAEIYKYRFDVIRNLDDF